MSLGLQKKCGSPGTDTWWEEELVSGIWRLISNMKVMTSDPVSMHVLREVAALRSVASCDVPETIKVQLGQEPD